MSLVDTVINLGFEVVVTSPDDFSIHLNNKLLSFKKVSGKTWEVNSMLKADEEKIVLTLREVKMRSVVNNLENTLTQLFSSDKV